MKVYLGLLVGFADARLHDFDVWLSNSSNPSSLQAGASLCMHHAGIVGKGATLSAYCEQQVAAQYLFVQIPGRGQRLTLCEVQAYAQGKPH